MRKRKSRAKPPPKKRMDKLDMVFSCPLCNHGTSVECHIMDSKLKMKKTGEVNLFLLKIMSVWV
ncbi:putative transcription elongation factor 1 [Helianthus anomalus]